MRVPCLQRSSQKHKVNHTRCCFLFRRSLLPLEPLPCPSEVQWTVSGGGGEMDGWSGWLTFRQTTNVWVFSPSERSLLALASSEAALPLKTEGRGGTMLSCRAHGEIRSKGQTSSQPPIYEPVTHAALPQLIVDEVL